MGFREELAEGTRGARLALPESFEWQRQGKAGGTVVDRERKALWVIQVSPFRFDLRREHDALLRADIERQARHEFEEIHRAEEHPPGSGGIRPPRTADPAWSPVVGVDRVRFGEADALAMIYRMKYQPGDELVIARLLVPLAGGTLDIGAYHRAQMTGVRESVLLVTKGPGAGFPAQHEYDDPELDAMFPEHPLSRARATLRWLTAPDGAGLAVTEPMPRDVPHEVEIPAAGCAITPPPRYLPPREGAVPAGPTVGMFARLALSTESHRYLDVMRHPRERIRGADALRALLRLSTRDAEGWAREGVTDITTDATPVSVDDGRTHVSNTIHATIGGERMRAVARWMADEGAVFRICATAPLYVTEQELFDEAHGALRSLRRLDVT